MRSRQLEHDELLVQNILRYLPDALVSMPYTILKMISDYYSNVTILQDPLAQVPFSDPVIISHPDFEPIVYDKLSVLIASELDELNIRGLTSKNIIEHLVPVPFLKVFTDYVLNSKNNYKLPLVKESKEDNSASVLLANLMDPEVTQNVNIANELKYKVDKAKSLGHKDLDLLEFVTKYNQPALRRKFNLVVGDMRQSYVVIPALADIMIMLINLKYNLSTKNYQFDLLLKYIVPGIVGLIIYFNTQYQKYMLNMQYIKSRDQACMGFVTYAHEPQTLQRRLIRFGSAASSMMQSIISNLMLFPFFPVSSLFVLSPLGFIITVGILCTMMTKSTPALVCTDILLREKEGTLRYPLPPRSRKSDFLTLVSLTNLAIYAYFIGKEDMNEWNRYFNFLGAALSVPVSIPRFLLASRYAVKECEDFMKQPSKLLEVAKDAEGFNEPSLTTFARRVTRFSASICMGVLAFVMTENPLFAIIAAVAMLSEGSLPYAIRAANNRYILLPSPVNSEINSAAVNKVENVERIFHKKA